MSKKHILIVDDELMLLYSLRRMLEDNYEITLALGGRKAIDLINKQTKQFDLILSDVSMPDVNGVNLYLYVERHFPGLEKRIIFITGGPTSVYLDEFFATKTNLCLSKPFETAKLNKAVKDFLDANPND